MNHEYGIEAYAPPGFIYMKALLVFIAEAPSFISQFLRELFIYPPRWQCIETMYGFTALCIVSFGRRLEFVQWRLLLFPVFSYIYVYLCKFIIQTLTLNPRKAYKIPSFVEAKPHPKWIEA